MDRRIFIRKGGLRLGAVLATNILGAENVSEPNSFILPSETSVKHFNLAIAGLTRHKKVSEIALGLLKTKANGFTGVYLLDDYIGWNWEPDGDSGFEKTWGDKQGWRYGYQNSFEAKIGIMKRSL